ncbi:hypothetical protein ABDK09_07025 [Vibrio sp. CDRSL-10 TSBA]
MNSFKVSQAGFSPKARASNFRGAAALTFIVSASIATTDLIFKDDYHLVDWFGNVGADMFKALLQYGAGEAMLLTVIATTGSIIAAGAAVAFTYLIIEWTWSEVHVNQNVVKALKDVIEN